MSLGVAVKGAEGIVLAADCRVTLGARVQGGPPVPLFVHFDNASKLFCFSPPHNYVGVVTYGAAVIGQQAPRTAHSYLPELEVTFQNQSRMKVREYAERLSTFFMEQWTKAGMPVGPDIVQMTFLVAGYDEGEAYGRVFLFEIPNKPDLVERNQDQDFGMTWGGQHELVSRLIRGFDPRLPAVLESAGVPEEKVKNVMQALQALLEFRIPYHVLPLQDCVDLATFLVRTTITAQTLAVGVRGVGGPIEVAVVTRQQGLTFIQQKKLRGEVGGHR